MLRSLTCGTMFKHRCICALFGGLALLTALRAAGTYENPVHSLDLPDPSLIRTDEGYWATATSSEWAPHFPILFSKDLVNWEQKGSVFEQAPAWAKGSFWAPEICEHDGTFFVYYTARRHDGRLVVAVATAPKPQGPYTDHGELVAQEMGSIDAMAVTDDGGRRWLLWKEDGNSRKKPTFIFLQPLSDDGLRLEGGRRKILTNDCPWEGPVVEGAFVLKHGDYYFLFYSGASCCGRNCNYALGVARAKRLEGPWQKHPSNPIMAGNDAWRCPGHGSIVQDPQGRFWMLYHAYAREGFVATGRQMLLDEITFGADGWPSINQGKGPSSQATAPAAVSRQISSGATADSFDGGPALRPGWQWPIRHRPEAMVAKGRLTLGPRGAVPAVLAQPLRQPAFVAETEVGMSDSTAAGLAVFGNGENSLALLAGRGKVALVLRQRGEDKELAAQEVSAAGAVKLRITSTEGRRFDFAYQTGTGDWREIFSHANGDFLPQWDRAVRVGLLVSDASGTAGTFEYFSLHTPPVHAAANE